VALLLLVPMGAASISFVATNNATLQLRADPAMRGRVMALNAIAFLGSTPIGAPLLGYVSDVSSPRVALALGGVATLLASIPLFVLAVRQRAAGEPEPVADDVVTAIAEAEAANVVPLPAVADPLPLLEVRVSAGGSRPG
jgi:MFS family permease